LVIVTAAAPARAADDDTATAAQFFRAGSAAFARGENRAAALAFEEAYRRVPRGAALFNAGLAWDAAGEPARAADAFAVAMQRGDLDAAAADTARRRLASVRQSLGWIEVSAPRGVLVSVAHAVRVPAPAIVHVRPGTHEVAAHYPSGRAQARTVTVAAGGAATAAFAPEPAPPPRSPTLAASAPTPEPPHMARAWGWAALGAAVASAAVASVLGVRALSARDEFSQSGYTSRDAHDRAATLRLWTNIGWAGALVLGGTGAAVLWSTSDRVR
jgi:hypothetical protein